MKKTVAILVNYNNYKDTKEAVNSLLDQSYPLYKIVVVDNCSLNKSFIELKKVYKENKNIIILQSKGNKGFSYGNNFGIKHMLRNFKFDYFLLINNDTVSDKDINKIFINYIENNKQKKIGILTGKIYFYDKPNKLWFAGGYFNKLKCSGYSFSRGKSDKGQFEEEKEINFATGCLWFFRKELINEIGLLPEEYFLYLEDVDFSLNLINNGYKIIYIPKIKIWHKIGLNFQNKKINTKYYYSNRNRIILARKFLKLNNRIAFYSFFIFTRFLKCILLLFTKGKLINTFTGIKEGLRYKTKKIKVLHTITRLIVGGAQENTILTAQLLDNNKYDVEVVSGIQLGAEGSLFEEAKKRNVEVTKFSNLVREISPLKDLIHLFEMIFFLYKKNYHIIHTHSSKAGIIHRIAAKIANVPITIHTVHGWSFHDELSSFSKKFYILLEKICSTFTDKIITVTDYDIKKGLTENIGKSEQYSTIHSSIEIERYKTPSKSKLKIIKELGINKNNIIVGTVSRMSAQKAPIDFMKAAKIICQKYPNTQFLFVGDGELRNEVENYIIQNGLVDKIILSGLRYDVPDLLHVMDIFILSSLWEGLPRVFSQAMAAKLPIVATKVNGAPEAIEEGENGFLVSPGKPQEMADKIEILLENEKLRKKMGEKGYRIVDSAFNVVNMVKNIEVVYEELLKKL